MFRATRPWAAIALAVGILSPAAAQSSLSLDSSSGYNWKVKDVGSDTSQAPAAKDFAVPADWKSGDVPGDLNAAGLVGENVTFWARLDGLKLPADWPKDSYLVLSDFSVDDSDTTYFNGKEIGSGSGATARKYIISPSLLDPGGNNVIAIKGTQGSGVAGLNQAPTLAPGPTDTGLVLITASSLASGSPVKNVLVTVKNDAGDDVDLLTDSSGQIQINDVKPGKFTVEVNAFPFIGSIAPLGIQSLDVAGGKVAVLDLKVTPFVYTVPKAAKPIVIDGDISGPEWDGAQVMDVSLKRQIAVNGAGDLAWKDANDLSGQAKWKWDDTYIYLAADVTDDVRVNEHVASPDGNIWQGDGFETYIQLDPYSRTRSAYAIDKNYQWTIGVAPDDSVAWKIFRATSTPNDVLPPGIPDPKDHTKVITKKGKTKGYILEARFPWASLPDIKKDLIPPKEGTLGAIALAMNDTDTEMSGTREVQLSWNSKADMWNTPSSFTTAIWGGVPGPVGVLGDVNNDGKVDLKDATLALAFAVNTKTADATQAKLGDVNSDGKLDLKDATLILGAAVGIRKL